MSSPLALFGSRAAWKLLALALLLWHAPVSDATRKPAVQAGANAAQADGTYRQHSCACDTAVFAAAAGSCILLQGQWRRLMLAGCTRGP
jgi:transposase